jgi:type IV secretory pathway VirB4 component
MTPPRGATQRSRRLVQSPVLPRVRARAWPAQRSGHRVSSAHLQAAYPFVAEGGLGSRGVYVGRDLHGGSFVYDPWELYGRELTDPNMVLVGHVGSAKSSLVKTLIYRQHVFGRVARVIDVKREYAPLAHGLGGTVIQLRPGGTIRLNPLTPLAGPERQLELLRAVTTATLHRRLCSEEDAALRVALNTVTARLADVEATLPDVVAALLAPTGEMADALVTTPDALAGAARDAALGLARLCQGDLQGMFDGPTTPGLDFDAPVVVLDLADVYSSEGLAIFMACATAFMQATITAHRTPGSVPSKVISVVDEAWRVLSELGLGEWLQSSFKLARQHGQQNIIVMHRFSDLSAAGAAGSRESRLAEGLLSDAGTRVVYRQNESEAPLAAQLLGLTETEAELLPGLGRGEAIWKVGQRSFFVSHLISAREAQLVDTDAAMARRPIEDAAS